MTDTIVYWTNDASDVYPLELTLRRSGEAVLYKPANSDNQTLDAGKYSGRVPSADYDALQTLLQSEDMKSLPEANDILPGEQISRFSLISGDAEQEFIVVAAAGNDTFSQAEALAKKIIESLLATPEYAAGVNLANVKHADNTMTADVLIRNSGGSDIQWIEPGAWEESGVQLVLVLTRSDIPAAEMGPQHQTFIPVTADMLTASQDSSAGPLLAANASINLGVRSEQTLEPGSYRAFIYFESPLIAENGETIMMVELETSPMELTK